MTTSNVNDELFELVDDDQAAPAAMDASDVNRTAPQSFGPAPAGQPHSFGPAPAGQSFGKAPDPLSGANDPWLQARAAPAPAVSLSATATASAPLER